MHIDNLFNSLVKDLTTMPYSVYTYDNTKSYNSHSKLFEQDNNIIFKCLATGINQDNIDISFDRKSLCIKSNNNDSDKDFSSVINEKINLTKSIDVTNSFANLDRGILTVTMPIDKKDTKQKITFRWYKSFIIYFFKTSFLLVFLYSQKVK